MTSYVNTIHNYLICLLSKGIKSFSSSSSLGESSEISITRLCKMLGRSHDDQRAGSFLKQRIVMALQIDNAACVLGTMSDRDAFEEFYYIVC